MCLAPASEFPHGRNGLDKYLCGTYFVIVAGIQPEESARLSVSLLETITRAAAFKLPLLKPPSRARAITTEQDGLALGLRIVDNSVLQQQQGTGCSRRSKPRQGCTNFYEATSPQT